MESFEQLRKQAIERREHCIALARAEYHQTLAKIKQLERTLGRRRPRPTKARPMVDLIADLIPRDRMFTIGEMVELLELAEPGRMFPTPSVRAWFQVLAAQGIVRRVQRADHRYVLWASVEHKTKDTGFGAKNMRVVAEALLREKGPLSTAEIVVTLQSRGYRVDSDPRMLNETVGAAMRNNPATFRRDRSGKWVVIED